MKASAFFLAASAGDQGGPTSCIASFRRRFVRLPLGWAADRPLPGGHLPLLARRRVRLRSPARGRRNDDRRTTDRDAQPGSLFDRPFQAAALTNLLLTFRGNPSF